MPRDDGGSNVLDLLAHPAQVNLLGAYANANQIAAGIWHNRRNQADQLAGEAFQGSLNPDGTPNQSQLNINLRNAGPGAALAAQDSSQKGQTLDQGTFVTHLARLTSLSGASMALAAQYPNGVPQEAVNAEIDQQASRLGLSSADVARAKSQFSADPAANTATIFRNHAANLSAQQQLMATRPGVTTIDNGQAVTGATVGAPLSNQPGAVTPTGPSTPTGYPTREQLLQQVGRPITDPDEAKRYGVPVGTVLTEPIIKRYIEQGGSHLVGPAGAPATPPTPSPIPGGGVYKPRGAAAPPPGAPSGGTQPPGAPAAVPSPQAPPTATPAPASTASEQPPAAPPYKGVVTSMPPGTEDTLKNDIALRTKAATDMGGMQKRLIAGQSALDALNMARTGPGTANETHMLAFLQAHNYDPPPKGQMSDTEYRQILVKNLLRFAQDSGRTAGTDLGLETQIHSNANADEMLKGANRHVLLQDLGILKRDIAQTEDMPEPSVGGAVREHLAKFPANTDPRAFMIDHLSPEDQKALLDEARKQGPNGKIYRSLEIAHRRGYITPPSQSAPAAAPPPPPSTPTKSTAGRPLAMAPTNYLAMA